MEKPSDFWLCTVGIAGSVIPSIERAFSRSVGRTLRGKVVFEDPVHHISGKISKKFRTTYNYRKASERKYTSIRGERTTPITPAEQIIQGKFSTVRAAALARSRDLAHLTADQAAFYAQKENGIPTFKAYIWSLEKARYDEQHG